MAADTATDDRFGVVLKKLDQVRQFAGPPRALTSLILESLSALTGASAALMVEPDPSAEPPWKTLATWSTGEATAQYLRPLLQSAAKAAPVAEANGWSRLDSGVGETRDHILAVRLEQGSTRTKWIVLLWLSRMSVPAAYEALCRVRLAAGIRADNEALQVASKGQAAAAQFASLLDLVGALHGQKRFLAAAMVLVNELAARHRCDRVSLGWLVRDVVVLTTVSHLEKFDRKLEVSQDLEKVMEEAVDQDSLVSHPPAVLDAGLITRTHAEFCRKHGTNFICSLPLRVDGNAIAAVTLERSAQPYSEDELRLLWQATELAAPRLHELKAADRWWGARAKDATLRAAATVVGPRHTGAKLLALAVTLLVVALAVIHVPHRLEASFTLQPSESAYLSAPFEGFLHEVKHEPGDSLRQGEPVVALETRELRLQEAALVADWERARRETDKARAAGQLPDMRVAQAQADQAKAQLDLVRQRLASAVLTAPFDAVIVEGDLKRRIGAPVRHGESLVQVARLDRMYFECFVSERDAPFLPRATTGEVAFASLPREKFPVRVTRLEPAAQVREAGSVFVVRAEAAALPDWWRPGMTGVAKLDAGERSLLWIFTHRTVEFLRLHLWW